MNKSERLEFYSATGLFLIILTLAQLCIQKRQFSHVMVNREAFSFAGFMATTNPADGKTIYLPLYFKDNK